MSFAQSLDSAVGAAVCNWLSNGGNAVLGNAVLIGLTTPGGTVPSVAAGLGLLALNYGCTFDPNTGGPAPGTEYVPGCQEVTSGDNLSLCKAWNDTHYAYFKKWIGAVRIAGPDGFGAYTYRITFVRANGVTSSEDWKMGPAQWASLRLVAAPTATCKVQQPPPDAPAAIPPYTYTDATTSCTYKVEHLAWAQDEFGTITPVVKISPGATALASGGIIGGCNFSPVLYVGRGGGRGGGGGGGYDQVWTWQDVPNDPDGTPWWKRILDVAIPAATGQIVAEIFRQLFKRNVAGRVYRIRSVCETNDQGEAVDQAREAVIPDMNIPEGTIARLDAIEYILQGLKDFKQPTCNSRPTYSGTPVTVRFQSDDPSPSGERPLRKHLRYRDTLSNPLEVHTDHWADFQWDAGPVIVQHTGGPWGVCKVWAASVDEGKRVIRHAGVVAGVDPDAQGRWIISGSADPRYGQTGRMRVERRSGAICVSSRPGPSGLPLIAYPSADS